MNTTLEPAALAAKSRCNLRDRTLASGRRSAAWMAALAVAITLAGCGFLKPAKETSRYFVLTPLPPGESAPVTAKPLAVGLGLPKLPAYLFETSLAVRKAANEIAYEPAVLWAERLDTGLQRVLAANLSTLLTTDQVRLSAWRSEEVAAEIYITVQQFDVNAAGGGVLVAWWRIVAPGGEGILKAGECRLTREGPAPGTDPAGAVSTMSELAGEFSRQLAGAIKAAM